MFKYLLVFFWALFTLIDYFISCDLGLKYYFFKEDTLDFDKYSNLFFRTILLKVFLSFVAMGLSLGIILYR